MIHDTSSFNADPDRSLVIRDACVITMDPDRGVLSQADIVIDADRIVSVGTGLEIPEGVPQLDGRGAIVIPGLIDSHRHVWQTLMRAMAADSTVIEYRSQLRGGVAPHYRPEDVYAATLLGDLEALNSGVTTVADLAHIMNSPDHADAAIQAHRDSGLRVLFAHGTPNDEDADLWYGSSRLPHPPDIRRLRSDVLFDDAALVTLGMHMRPPYLVNAEILAADFALARDLDIHISMDGGLGGGCWGGPRWGEPGRRPIADLYAQDLLGPGLTVVHGNNLPDSELKLIAECGVHVSISPDTEMNCGHGEPVTPGLLKHGVRPSLSIDSVVWSAGDLFGAMRAIINHVRGRLGRESYESGVPIDRWTFRTEDVLEFATVQGARSCGLADRVGRIAPGLKADLVVLRGDPLNLHPLNDPIASVVMAAHPGNVDTVIVEGRLVKQRGELVGVDVSRCLDDAQRARDHILQDFGGASPGDGDDSRRWEWV